MPQLRGNDYINNKHKTTKKKKSKDDQDYPQIDSTTSSSSNNNISNDKTLREHKWPIQDPASLHHHHQQQPQNDAHEEKESVDTQRYDKRDSKNDPNEDQNAMIQGKEYVKEETEVVYPDSIQDHLNNDLLMENRSNKSKSKSTNTSRSSEKNDAHEDNDDDQEELEIDIDPDKLIKVEDALTTRSSSCPPLFIPLTYYSEDIPPFHSRLQCNLSTHPALYLTSIFTILLFIYCTCCKKPLIRYSICPCFFHFFQKKKATDSNARGEYSALETVYDELLDDFENEDLSSYLNDDDDDDDDSEDSVGTIISQWSEGGDNIGNGRIELTNFDDGNLHLKE